MGSTSTVQATWLLVAWLAIIVLSAQAHEFGRSAASVAFSPRNFNTRNQVLSIRGGVSTAVDSDEDIDLDESEDESESEDEEEEPVSSKLSASAVKAAAKTQAKKTSNLKKVVNENLSKVETTKTAAENAIKKKRRSSSKFSLPYIIKASLNPFTLIAMTKAYWASLFKLDYIQKDSSQDLRSALEQKAKKAGGGAKGRRKMKPGQAKTISDLPQLNT